MFDRLPIAHRINLFDMNRLYGDVMPVAEVLAYIEQTGRRGKQRAA